MIDLAPQIIEDNDSLYVLPLQVLPIKSRPIRRARLIKDSRLNSVIELFYSKEGGSGQLYLHELEEEMFSDNRTDRDNDKHILKSVAKLQSFDVYSLRICLRGANIELHDSQYLSLSADKKRELADYMKAFTLPLIEQVYGKDGLDLNGTTDIIKLFSDPDMETAIKKLNLLSNKLNIKLQEIPRFLEDFSDIYLSFAYYQQYLDLITDELVEFLEDIDSLKENWQMRHDFRLMEACDAIEDHMNNLVSGITGRFESFNQKTDDMWENITAERFKSIQELFTSQHTTIGGVLCGLGGKMGTWRTAFPSRETGGPVSRAEVLLADIIPGMDKIIKLERSTSTPIALAS